MLVAFFSSGEGDRLEWQMERDCSLLLTNFGDTGEIGERREKRKLEGMVGNYTTSGVVWLELCGLFGIFGQSLWFGDSVAQVKVLKQLLFENDDDLRKALFEPAASRLEVFDV